MLVTTPLPFVTGCVSFQMGDHLRTDILKDSFFKTNAPSHHTEFFPLVKFIESEDHLSRSLSISPWQRLGSLLLEEIKTMARHC